MKIKISFSTIFRNLWHCILIGLNWCMFMLFFTFPSQMLVADDNYISPTGNDASGNGTSSSPYATLSKAISKVGASDTIFVLPGTYTIKDFDPADNQTIVIKSTEGASTTFFDPGLTGNNTGRILELDNHSNDFHVIGITFKNGNHTGTNYTGGGAVYIRDSKPVFKNCVFKSNEITGQYGQKRGGAVYIQVDNPSETTAQPQFYDCLFDSNKVSGTYANNYGGGAVYISHGGNVSSGDGHSQTYVKFERCTFTNNQVIGHNSQWDVRGGAVYARSNTEFINCLFASNSVSNTDFSGNSVNNGDGGGGLFIAPRYNSYSGTVKIVNCTIANNSSVGNSGAIRGGWDDGMRLFIFNSIIWGNTNSNNDNIQIDRNNLYMFSDYNNLQYKDSHAFQMGSNSMEIRPNFVDESGGDYSLSDYSQVIGKGAASYTADGVTISAPTKDITGSTDRPSTRPDLGAYENSRNTPLSMYKITVATTGSDATGTGKDDAPFASLSKAIDFAVTGDTIQIKPGTYKGASNRGLDPGGKSLVIIAYDLNDKPVFDADSTDRHFRFNSDGDSTTQIISLVFINGKKKNSSGGSILVEHGVGATPTFRNCTFKHNRTENSDGGAVSIQGPKAGLGRTVQFIDCVFDSNWIEITSNNQGGSGGAIRIGSGSNNPSNPHTETPVRFENCLIKNNYITMGDKDSWPNGGAMYLEYNTDIINCVIASNQIKSTRYNHGNGGAISANPNWWIHERQEHDNGILRIVNSTIANNYSAGNDGGISGWGNGNASNEPVWVIVNSMIWDNTSYYNSNQPIAIHQGTFYCDYNNIQHKSSFSGAGSHSIEKKPWFNDPDNNDFTATQYSGFIKKGTGSFTYGTTSLSIPTTDINGKARNSVTPDMGAYESDFTEPVITGVYVTKAGNDTTGNGTAATPFRSLGKAVAEAMEGDSIIVGPGTYKGEDNRNINPGKNLVIKSSDGASSTILNAESSGRHFNFNSSFGTIDTTFQIIGFSFVYGKSSGNGGSIAIENGAAPVIKNSIFKNNQVNDAGGGAVNIGGYNGSVTMASQFIDCLFDSNSANIISENGWAEAGAIRINETWDYAPSNPVTEPAVRLVRCKFINNSVNAGSYNGHLQGGAIMAWNSVDIINCVVANNKVTSDSHNGGIGGIGAFSRWWQNDQSTGGFVRIINSTIVNNTSDGGSGGIGGWHSETNLVLFNSIIWGNRGHQDSEGKQIDFNGTLYSDYNDIEFTKHYSDVGEHSIEKKPWFSDPDNNDFTATQYSGFIKHGGASLSYLDTSVTVPATDINGKARNGFSPDMGAYESDFTEAVETNVYVKINGNDDTADGTESLPFASLGKAIEFAINGDILIVGPGTYSGENNCGLNPSGKNLVIMSSDGAGSTIFDADSSNRHFTLSSGEDTSFQIIGFTFRNGHKTSGGGSIQISNESTPVFKNCFFKHNSVANSDGGAIRIEGMNQEKGMAPKFIDCIFDSNQVVITANNRGGSGGAISIDGRFYEPSNRLTDPPVLFNRTVFTNNSVNLGDYDSWGEGGAVVTRSNTNFINCLIANNKVISSSHHGNGGALTLNPSWWIHSTQQNENGIVRIVNCTIVNNFSDGGQGGVSGWGQYDASNEPVWVLVNSIFWGNRSIHDGETQISIHEGEFYSDYNNIELLDSYSNAGPNSIEKNPWFNDPDNQDYTPTQYSGFIGKGITGFFTYEDTSVSIPSVDINGNIRPLSNPDMGAYESDYNVALTTNINVAVTGNDTLGNGTADSPFSSISRAIDFATTGDTIIVNPGTYKEKVDFRGKNVVVGSKYLTTKDTSYVRQTVIDGNHEGTVITFSSGEDSSAALIGFTIQNGKAKSHGGGGVYIRSDWGQKTTPTLSHLNICNNASTKEGGGLLVEDNAAPTLTNLVITNNTAFQGGGICIRNASPGFSNSIISRNRAYQVGGAMVIDGGWGEDKIAPIVLNNMLIADNSSFPENEGEENWGVGGINIWGQELDIVLVNCTVTNNSSLWTAGIGAWPNNGSLALINSIVFGNTCVFNDEEVNYSDIEWSDQTATIVLHSNLGRRWRSEEMSRGIDELVEDDGNIWMSTDPLFVDPENGDYRLKDSSPCIGIGLDTSLVLSEDLMGNPRINPERSWPDLGTYENATGIQYLPILFPIEDQVILEDDTIRVTVAAEDSSGAEIKTYEVYGDTNILYLVDTDTVMLFTVPNYYPGDPVELYARAISTDGIKSQPDTFFVSIVSINDPPVPTLEYHKVEENGLTKIVLTADPGSEYETDQTITYYLTGLPKVGTLGITQEFDVITESELPLQLSDSVLYFNAPENRFYQDHFSYSVKDNGGTEYSGLDSSNSVEVILMMNIPATFLKYTDGSIEGGVTILDENSIYTASSGDAVYRFDKNGNLHYKLNVDGDIKSVTTVTPDYNIYIASTDYNLYSFNANGVSNQNWPLALGSEATASVAVDNNNNIYIGTQNGIFQAVAPNRQILWSYNVSAPVYSSAAVTESGDLIFANYEGAIFSINLEAALLNPNNVQTNWILDVGERIVSSPAIDGQFIYFTTLDGNLIKINGSGELPDIVWSYSTGDTIVSSPVISSNHTVYTGSNDGGFHAVDSESGESVWIFWTGGPVKSTAAIAEFGGNMDRIYLGSDGGFIYALDLYNGNPVWVYEANSPLQSALLFYDNVIYAGTMSGEVIGIPDPEPASSPLGSRTYAAGTSSGEMTGAPDSEQVSSSSGSRAIAVAPIWHTFQGNNQRTGNLRASLLSIDDALSLPTEFGMKQNYPNPFNPNTTILYGLPEDSYVKIIIYNILGRQVRTLVNEQMVAGYHSVIWNGKDEIGRPISAGVYLYQISARSLGQAGEFTKTRKMLLLK